MVTKKKDPPRTSLHLLSHYFQPPSLFFSSTLSKIRPAIFECLAMPKCTPMSKCEVSLDLSHTTPIVESLPDDVALLDKQLQWQINNKSRGLRHVKLGQDTLHVLAVELYTKAHKFDIKKQHWGRYQIMQKKSCQYQHYGMGGTGKHQTIKDETSEYWYLTTFRKSCQCRNVGSQLTLGM